MSDALRVDDTSLTASAARCVEHAQNLEAAGQAPQLGPAWQPSAAAVTALLTDADGVRTTMAAHIQTTSAALSDAARSYADSDAQGADRLSTQMGF